MREREARQARVLREAGLSGCDLRKMEVGWTIALEGVNITEVAVERKGVEIREGVGIKRH